MTGTLERPTARALGVAAISLGIVADSLFRTGPGGVGIGIWIGLVALNLAALVWRDGRALPRESAIWLAAAVSFALGLAWRNSETLSAFNFLAAWGCLAMAAVRLRDRRAGVLAARFRQTVAGLMALATNVFAGLVPVAFADLTRPSDAPRLGGRMKPVLRTFGLGIGVVAVFTPLLRGADPIFASFVVLPDIDVAELFSHVFVVGVFAWLVAGWARGALLPTPDRRVARYGFSLGLADVTTILGTLDALFALFVIAQLGWIFGGETFLRERTGLTASAYARQGFFSMVWIVALVVPVLVITRSTLASGTALRRRHTLLSIPAIALLGAMIGSALLRMRMYVDFFGLTTDRFYPLVFMAWLSFVLVWLAATVLRGRGRTFIAGTLTSGLLTLATLNVADPDAIIARVNVSRRKIDLEHLASLRGGAVSVATRAVIDGAQAEAGDRCDAAKALLRRWGPESRTRIRAETIGAWRYWNAGDAEALRVVSRHSATLRNVAHATCRPAPAQR